MTQKLWYIIRQATGTCKITNQPSDSSLRQWGSYQTKEEAIAKKIGLIRAGQCQPE